MFLFYAKQNNCCGSGNCTELFVCLFVVVSATKQSFFLLILSKGGASHSRRPFVRTQRAFLRQASFTVTRTTAFVWFGLNYSVCCQFLFLPCLLLPYVFIVKLVFNNHPQALDTSYVVYQSNHSLNKGCIIATCFVSCDPLHWRIKWFEPRIHAMTLTMITRVSVALRRTVVNLVSRVSLLRRRLHAGW